MRGLGEHSDVDFSLRAGLLVWIVRLVLEIMGDHAMARRWYEEFLTIWKNADPDIPIYRQAKAEYARLGKEIATN